MGKYKPKIISREGAKAQSFDFSPIPKARVSKTMNLKHGIHYCFRNTFLSTLCAFAPLREVITTNPETIYAGYLKTNKPFKNKRPNTSYAITQKGVKAFEQYVDVLQQYLDVSKNKC